MIAQPVAAAEVPVQGAGGPLRLVLGALEGGAGSLAEVSARTGLERQLVEAAVHHLVRLGHLEATELSMGCPPAGCGGCASAEPGGTAGCGASAPSAARRGPTLVALSVRRSSSAE